MTQSTEHISVNRTLSESKCAELLKMDMSALRLICERLYQESRRAFVSACTDVSLAQKVFGARAEEWKEIVELKRISAFSHYDMLPIYRFDFICAVSGLSMTEITPLPAPAVFLNPFLWSPVNAQVWPYNQIVFIILSETFSGQSTVDSISQYVDEKSAAPIRAICQSRMTTSVYHYSTALSHSEWQELGPAGTACYWWCEPEFLDTHPALLRESKARALAAQWIEPVSLEEYLFAGSKFLHVVLKDSQSGLLEEANLVPHTTRLSTSLREWAVESRDQLVLKKGMSSEGRDVYLGCAMSGEEWRQTLDDALRVPGCGYVLQRYVPARQVHVDNKPYALECRVFYHPVLPSIDSLLYLIPWETRYRKGNCCCNPTIRLCSIDYR
jgi:hypothetical protein